MIASNLNLSLRTPSPERLEELSRLLYDCSFEETGDDRSVVYAQAVQEMQASALAVIAEFLSSVAR